MIEELERNSDRILGFRMSGKLHDQDYRTFVPVVEEAMQAHGKVRMLAQFHDSRAWICTRSGNRMQILKTSLPHEDEAKLQAALTGAKT